MILRKIANPAHIENLTKNFNLHNPHYKVYKKIINTKTLYQKQILNYEIKNIISQINNLANFALFLKHRLLRSIHEVAIQNFFKS